MADDFDLESLLSDILDDSKPLPTKPTVAQAVVNTQLNATGNKAGSVAMDNPEDFLESLMNDETPAAPTPMDVARAAEVGAELAAAEAGLNGEATGSVIDDADLLEAIGGGGQVAAVTQSVTPGAIFADSADREEGSAVVPVKMPTFTGADFAEAMDIRNFATLVTLNTARWHAKVKDRQASKDAATANDADAGAFETRKHLLGGASAALKAIHKAIDEARAAHYEMTLPWTTTSMQDIGRRTGGRLLPNTLFVEYTTVMAQKKQQMLDALNKFEPEYPALVEASKKKLGKRFDAREYPNVSSIRSHFDLSFDFQPIPQGDDFKGLPQVQLDALARKINDNTQKQAENAMQEVWIRLYDVVSKMAERLSTADKLFHNTLVQNVRDTARLLAHLNVTNDPKVEALRKKVEKHLCQHDPKELRENLTIRTQVAAHAASIIQEMNK
jgi:hypothetical protein